MQKLEVTARLITDYDYNWLVSAMAAVCGKMNAAVLEIVI